jgi:hypothetical protein
MTYRRTFTTLVALILSAAPLRADEGADDAAHAVVAEVEGTVEARFSAGEDWGPLTPDTVLEPGDSVRTGDGSSARLVNGDGDVVEVQENSEVEVGDQLPKQSAFRLFLGGLLAKVSPDPGKKFRISTPIAVAAVRGTEFVVDVSDDGGTEVGVSEGKISLQGTSADGTAEGEEVVVDRAQGATARRGAALRRDARWSARVGRRMERMAAVRERAPGLRGRWRRLPPDQRRELRRQTIDRWRRMPPEQRQRIRGEWRRETRQELRREAAPARRQKVIERRRQRRDPPGRR